MLSSGTLGNLKIIIKSLFNLPDTNSSSRLGTEHSITAPSVSGAFLVGFSFFPPVNQSASKIASEIISNSIMKKIAYLIIIMIISLVNFTASLQWKYWIEENVSKSG